MESLKKTVISLPGITVNHQSEFMQNYLAESIIDVGHGLRSLKQGTDGAIVFFIGNDGILTALISESGNGSGWRAEKLSHKACTATSFDFDYNEQTGSFRLAFAEVKDSSSALFVSEEVNLAGLDFTDFQQQLNFQSQLLKDPARAINQITMDKAGLLFSSMATGTDALYHYLIYGGTPEAYTLPENTGQVKQLMIGRLFNRSGVFVLYEMAKSRTMLFQSFLSGGETETVQRRFAVDDTINCFDLLPADKKGNSQLYVAGKGIYTYKTPSLVKEQVAPGSSEYTRINVSQNGAEISIWAIGNSKGSNGLYFITNQYYQFDAALGVQDIITKWTYPIQMHSGITDFSSLKGDNFTNQLFLFGKANHGGNGLIHFWQDKISTSWQENLLSIKDLNSVSEISSYTIDIDFIPDTASIEITDKIFISAEENMVLYIDNEKYFLTHGNQIALDFKTSVNIIIPIDSLAVPQIRISAGFLGGDIEIDPSKGIRTALREKIKSGNDLADIKRPDGSPLLTKKFDQAELDEVAKVLGQVLSEGERIENSSMAMEMAHGTYGFDGAGLISDMGHAIGDIWYSAKKGFTEISDLVVENIGKVVTFVIEVGGKVIRWVIDKVSAAVSFLERVWEKVKVFFNDLYETFAFLFDWDDIIETKRALKQMGFNYLEEAKASLESYKAMAVNYILDLRAKYEEMGEAIDRKYLKNANLLDMMNDNSKQETVDSRVNWLNGKKDVVFGNDAKLSSGVLTTDATEKIKAETKAKDVPSEMADLLIALLKGEIGFGEFMEKFANKIVLMALDIAKKIVELFFDLIVKTVDFISAVLYTPIDIPLLSYLYKKIAHDELSVADLIALIIAIPVTVGYKLEHKEAPFKKDDQEFINSLNFA